MPKVPVDYAKTIIYILVHFNDLNNENVYVGHCTNMTKRKCQHKTTCCNPNDKKHNLKVYQFIRENGGWDQWEMILVEKYPCDNVDQARARERYWKRELNATLNTYEPGRTSKEWFDDNKEILAEKAKIYYRENIENKSNYDKERYNNLKEEIAEKNKEKTTCECGSVFRKCTIARHHNTKKHQEWVKNNNLTIK